ncbi:MAG: transposase [Alphaproteobacteria bacterium]
MAGPTFAAMRLQAGLRRASSARRGYQQTARLRQRPIEGAADRQAVVYFYSTDRKGEHPRAFLEGFNGVLQADGFTGFNAMYEPDP